MKDSTWSLRPWLILKWSKLPFEERFISLDQPGYGEGKIAAIRAVSPSGCVPALQIGDLAIWDSLAIAEWTAEHAPQAALWPRDPAQRALARAVTCEMHSGFSALRAALPMNIRRRCPAQNWSKDVRLDLARIEDILHNAATNMEKPVPIFSVSARSLTRSIRPSRPACARMALNPDVLPWTIARRCLPMTRFLNRKSWPRQSGRGRSRGPESMRCMSDVVFGERHRDSNAAECPA